jgi:hypothetical protein
MRKAYERISEALRPWADREAAGNHYWEGKTEAEALRLANDVHRELRDNPRGLTKEGAYDHVKEQLDLYGNNAGEIKAFMDHAKKARNKRGPARDLSKHAEYGVPHTAGKEELWTALLSESGIPTKMLNSGTGDPFVTDLESMINGVRKLVDVQNYYPISNATPVMELGVIKNIGNHRTTTSDRGLVQHVYKNAQAGDTLGNLVDDIKSSSRMHGDGKLLATTDTRFNNKPDGNMRNNADSYGVDYLIGGKYDRSAVNNLTKSTHGNYDPELTETNKIYDMSRVRENLLNLPTGEYERNGIKLIPRPHSLGVQVPIETMDQLGGVNANDFLAQKVLQAMEDIKKGGLR